MVKLPDEDISLNVLREDHGDRSAKFIKERVLINNDGTKFHFGEYDDVYMEYLPLICASHMQEFSFVEKLPESYFLDDMEVDISLCAILLRLADAMDLMRNRAPYQLYQFLVNRSISPEHWKKHMSVSSCRINKKGVYQVNGICHDEFAHRCLYNHLDMIESEIEKVFKWKNEPHPRLKLRSHLVTRKIKTDAYKMWHHSFVMDVLKITNLFMGEQLYGDKKLGLREIIQNSIDACMVRDEINKSLGNKQDYIYKPEITIIFDRQNNQVIVRDNGTGMNDYIIEHYFLNIGASYYSSRDFKKKNLKYNPSGYFGIGFLSSFMLSDDVYVRTAHWQEDVEYEFHFIISDRFVTKTERPKTFSGTEIRLNLNQFIEVFTYKRDNIQRDIENIIGDYLNQIFWNLKINRYNNVLTCPMRTETFLEYAKNIDIFNYDYHIDLSEYLIDIEGLISLNHNNFYLSMKNLYEMGESLPLDALRKEKIYICDGIKGLFPFVKHFYAYDTTSGSHYEIKDDTSEYFNSFIFFPTEESKIDINDKDYISLNSKIKDIFWLNSWNCFCTKDIEDRNDQEDKITFEKLRYDSMKISDYLEYTPACFIKISGYDTHIMKNLVYTDISSMLLNKDIRRLYWIKHASIDLPLSINQPLKFSFFQIDSIIMRIENSLIKSDSARKNIINTSTTILVKAIGICVILWVYDKIKTYKEANKSTEYLRRLILKEWDDSVEGLLRPEKKPV